MNTMRRFPTRSQHSAIAFNEESRLLAHVSTDAATPLPPISLLVGQQQPLAVRDAAELVL